MKISLTIRITNKTPKKNKIKIKYYELVKNVSQNK